MPEQFDIKDLRHEPWRDGFLALNNASAEETSFLSPQRFDHLIGASRVALGIPPAAALLLAFEPTADYDGVHFLWFRNRSSDFLYIDRIVVAEQHRRSGVGRKLYAEVFEQAARLGHTRLVCEVNIKPANPVSDRFHAERGFEEVGRAELNGGAKVVRYLEARL